MNGKTVVEKLVELLDTLEEKLEGKEHECTNRGECINPDRAKEYIRMDEIEKELKGMNPKVASPEIIKARDLVKEHNDLSEGLLNRLYGEMQKRKHTELKEAAEIEIMLQKSIAIRRSIDAIARDLNPFNHLLKEILKS